MSGCLSPMTTDDLADVVRIHQSSFQGFFLTKMGTSFLVQYYQTVLNYEKSIAVVSRSSSGSVDGFAVGFVDPELFYKFFRSRRIGFLPSIFWAVVKQPSLISAILKNAKRLKLLLRVECR